MAYLNQHGEHRGAPADGQLLRYADGWPITSRRYDHLWVRIGQHLPWVATQQISTHWLRHTTLTWVERNFGYAVARAYAGHADNANAGTTATNAAPTSPKSPPHSPPSPANPTHWPQIQSTTRDDRLALRPAWHVQHNATAATRPLDLPQPPHCQGGATGGGSPRRSPSRSRPRS